MTYNMMSCAGWGSSGYSILGDCSLSWVSFTIVLILALVLRRQLSDGVLAGMASFNVVGALIVGLGANFVTTLLTGSPRWSLVIGIAGVIVGGYIIGKFSDQTGGDEGT